MFEHRKEEMISLEVFIWRQTKFFLISIGIILSALGVGVLGYHFIAHLAWIDAFLNASMILSGMGPVDTLESDAAKLFASIYAIFSGVVFISASGILFAPVAHRILHRFHIE